MTLEEAEELNSKCAFCGKDKFKVREIHGEPHLVRCGKPECEKHCQFDHKLERQQLPDGREDVVEIASGWGAR